MKTTTTLILILFCSFKLFSQANNDTSYYIELCQDKMTDKKYAFGSKNLLCTENGKKGFRISITWNNKEGEITYNGFTVNSAGIGSCNENDEIIFLYIDDSKSKLTSWNKFNCEGKSYFDLYGKSLDEISSKKVKAIRFMNGRSYESYTHNLTEKDQSYFINARIALENKFFRNTSCD
jgi:hypothetical protein